MNIIIHGMKLPKAGDCFIVYPDGEVWSSWKSIGMVGTAIELPPHGRLIDADAFAATYIADMPDAIHELKDKRKVPMFVNQIQALLMDIAEAPTILPADPDGGDANAD